MNKNQLFTRVLILSFFVFLVNSVFAQSKKELREKQELENFIKDLESSILKEPLSSDNGIDYGISILKIERYFDDIDSIWIEDPYVSSEPFKLDEIFYTDILDYSIDTVGPLIIQNGMADMLSQNHGFFSSREQRDILDNLYLPLTIEKQRYGYIFTLDKDYTFLELRIMFSKIQDINGFEVKLNLADPLSLESFVRTNPEAIIAIMKDKVDGKIYALGNQDIYTSTNTVTFTTSSNTRLKKTYSSVGYALAVFIKGSQDASNISVHTSLDSKYSHELIIKMGEKILLTSRHGVDI
jgi:hypothetical protein